MSSTQFTQTTTTDLAFLLGFYAGVNQDKKDFNHPHALYTVAKMAMIIYGNSGIDGKPGELADLDHLFRGSLKPGSGFVSDKKQLRNVSLDGLPSEYTKTGDLLIKDSKMLCEDPGRKYMARKVNELARDIKIGDARKRMSKGTFIRYFREFRKLHIAFRQILQMDFMQFLEDHIFELTLKEN